MPEYFAKFKEQDDHRRKLLTSQYPAVRRYYAKTKSQRKTAAHFGVSRRLIIFILYPERLEALKADHAARKWHKLYPTPQEKLTAYKREREQRKKDLGGYKLTSAQAAAQGYKTQSRKRSKSK